MAELLQRLGDAVAGIDREGAYREGLNERALLTQRQSSADAAMALARQRRMQAEREQMQNEAVRRVQEGAFDLTDPNAGIGDLIVAGLGSDYSAVQQGRLRGQEFGNRDTIADPMIEDEQVRQRAAQAVFPNDLADPTLGNEVFDPGPLELVDTPEGSRYSTRADAVGKAPGVRPSASSSAASDALGLGLDPADTNAIYRQAATLWGGTIDPNGNFTALDPVTAQRAQSVATRASQLFAGGGLSHSEAVSRAFSELRDRPGWNEDPLGGTGLGDSVFGGEEGPVPVSTPEELESLPSGTRFRAPDGSIRIKP